MNVTLVILFFDLWVKNESFITDNHVPFHSSPFVLLLLHFCKKSCVYSTWKDSFMIQPPTNEDRTNPNSEHIRVLHYFGWVLVFWTRAWLKTNTTKSKMRNTIQTQQNCHNQSIRKCHLQGVRCKNTIMN